MFTFGMIATQAIVSPTVAYADGSDVSTVADSIKNGSSGAIESSGAKTKVTSIFHDLQSIVLVVVIGILSLTGIFTAVKFANAGDNPTAKANLKTILIFHILGIVFLGSYFGLIAFGLKINLFGS